MALSGSFDYSITALEAITAAMQDCGAISDGETVSSSDLTICLGKFNRLVKQWQGTNDFAPGLKMWTRKRAYIFLQKAQGSYSLGPSGDNATASYVSTTISATEAAGQTVLSITSSTGMTAADYIGIELDTGYIQWTTVSSTGAGTVTVGAALTSQASAGNMVFAYTSKIPRPLEIITAVLRDTDGNDAPLTPMDIYAYEALPSKADDGDPIKYYFEGQITNAVIYFDVEPSDVTKVVRAVYYSPVDDLDSSANDIYIPQHWYRPLVAQLSIEFSVAFRTPITENMKLVRDESLQIAQNADPETTTLYFQPGAE